MTRAGGSFLAVRIDPGERAADQLRRVTHARWMPPAHQRHLPASLSDQRRSGSRRGVCTHASRPPALLRPEPSWGLDEGDWGLAAFVQRAGRAAGHHGQTASDHDHLQRRRQHRVAKEIFPGKVVTCDFDIPFHHLNHQPGINDRYTIKYYRVNWECQDIYWRGSPGLREAGRNWPGACRAVQRKARGAGRARFRRWHQGMEGGRGS